MFPRLKAFFKKLKALWRRIDEKLLHNAMIALAVTKLLKKAIDSKEVILFTQITPTELDDKGREILSRAFEKIIAGLNIQLKCSEAPTIEDKIICWVESIRDYNPMLHEALLIKAASVITREFQGEDDFRESEVNTILQDLFYTHKVA